MPPDHVWEWIRLAEHNSLLNPRSLPEKPVFEPGDIAFAYGNIYSCFFQFLGDQGYWLKSFEDDIRSSPLQKGRYCIVIGRTDDEKYIVYFLTTFGRSQGHSAEIGPIARYFGVPIGETSWPPITGIKILPRWRYQSFAFCVPVIRDNLQLSNLNTRLYLAPGELDRLNNLCEERLKHLDKIQSRLRAEQLVWMRSRRHQFENGLHDLSVSVPPRRLRIGVRLPRKRDGDSTTPLPPRHLIIPTSQSDGKWLTRYLSEDLDNRSAYLNTLASKPLKRQVLPLPYFAPSLRNSAAAIARIIH